MSTMSEYGEEVGEQVKGTAVALGEIRWVEQPAGFWWPGQVVEENTINEDKISGKKSPGDVLVRLYGTCNYSYIDPIKSQLEFDTILKKNNGSHMQIFLQSLEKDLSLNKPLKLKGQGAKSETNTRIDSSRGKSSVKRRSGKSASSSTSKKKLRSNCSSKARIKNDEQDMLQNKSKTRHAGFKNGVKNKTHEDEDMTVLKHSKENPRQKTPMKSEPNYDSSLKSQRQSGRKVKVMQNLGLIAPYGSPFLKSDVSNLPS